MPGSDCIVPVGADAFPGMDGAPGNDGTPGMEGAPGNDGVPGIKGIDVGEPGIDGDGSDPPPGSCGGVILAPRAWSSGDSL